MENALLLLSGGIHDVYYTDIAAHLNEQSKDIVFQIAISYFNKFNKQYKKANQMIPNVNELYEIIKYAIQSLNIVGCYAINEKLQSKYGIQCRHQYHVVDTYQTSNGQKFLKIQNPHNSSDKIKSGSKYAELEVKLKKLGIQSPAYPGEFLYKKFYGKNLNIY